MKTINVITIIGLIVGVFAYWVDSITGIITIILVLSWWSGCSIVYESHEISKEMKMSPGRRGHRRH